MVRTRDPVLRLVARSVACGSRGNHVGLGDARPSDCLDGYSVCIASPDGHPNPVVSDRSANPYRNPRCHIDEIARHDAGCNRVSARVVNSVCRRFRIYDRRCLAVSHRVKRAHRNRDDYGRENRPANDTSRQRPRGSRPKRLRTGDLRNDQYFTDRRLPGHHESGRSHTSGRGHGLSCR